MSAMALASTIWPDWTGQTCAIIASGPSVKKADVELLRGRLKVLAIKKSVELAPWADVVYGCDFPWWRSVQGLPAFGGLKISFNPRHLADAGVRKVDIVVKDAAGQLCDRLLTGEVGRIGNGGNSGFQALNLAVQWGATRVLLLGFDCQDRSGAHWYGRNMAAGMNNPGPNNFRRWIAAFNAAAVELRSRGIEVLNASQISDVRCWPRIGVADALERWGL